MKNLSLLLILSFCFQYGIAQTKLIAYKRHSGSNFSYALTSNPNDIASSNFGMRMEPRVKNAQLDTVIFIDKERAIMITSEYCKDEFWIESKENNATLWKAGRDTVYNHPLFSQQHNLDGIKKILKEKYHFKNDIDKVIFIGYDNKKSRKKKSDFTLFSFFSNADYDGMQGNRLGFSFYLMGIGLSFACSLLAYLLYMERSKKLRNVY